MEQNHPIPQQISSYQFRLVGDMTLKQFFQLAGGVLVGLLFYALPINGFIKWPIIIFAVLMGAALAFLPFEERPLERWIVAFFRSIYSPTLFSWKKTEVEKKYYQNEASAPEQKILAPQGVDAMNAYLATPTTSTSFFTKLEQGEKGFLSRVGDLFGPGSPNKGAVAVTPNTDTSTQAAIQATVVAPVINTNPAQIAKPNLEIPVTQTVAIPKDSRPKLIVEETDGTSPNITVTGVAPLGTAPSQGGMAPDFSPDAAPPNPPSIPNTVSGQVVSPTKGIVEGAILEIRDISGRPVRALKSNRLGHFYIVTALLNGTYEIITEKEGYEFAPVKFEAEGMLIPPIAIKALREIPNPQLISTQNPSPTFNQAVQ